MVKCLVNGLLLENANRILGFVILVLFLKFERATPHRIFFVYVRKALSQVSTKMRPHTTFCLLPKSILFIISLSAKGFVCFHILATWIRFIRLGTTGAPRSWHLGILSSLHLSRAWASLPRSRRQVGAVHTRKQIVLNKMQDHFKDVRIHIVICQLLMSSCTELVLGSAQLQWRFVFLHQYLSTPLIRKNSTGPRIIPLYSRS